MASPGRKNTRNFRIMKKLALQHLRTALDNETATFRAGQWESIESLLNRHRMLLVQRTGWGKSMVYFLATRLLRDAGEGVSLLISPLLSLMRNQLEAAARIGVRAATINSSNTDEWREIERQLRDDAIDILLVSPERLANQQFNANILTECGRQGRTFHRRRSPLYFGLGA